MRCLSLFVILLLIPGTARAADALEESVCGILGLEGFMYSTWSAIAERHPDARPRPGYEYRQLTLTSHGGTVLRGLRISPEGGGNRHALLVLQGNAMRAGHLVADFPFFVERGFDVFVFDYRGYGGSEGTPRLKAIGLDQDLVTAALGERGYRQLFLYGISMGGIYSMGPHMPRGAFGAIVIDSSPARFPWWGLCPDAYQPVNQVPADAANVLVISGGRDGVVPASDVEPLGKAVEAAGGRYHHVPDFRHPMAESAADKRRRFEIVADFLESFRAGE